MQMLPGFYGIWHIKLLHMIPSVTVACLAHSNGVSADWPVTPWETVRRLLKVPTRKINWCLEIGTASQNVKNRNIIVWQQLKRSRGKTKDWTQGRYIPWDIHISNLFLLVSCYPLKQRSVYVHLPYIRLTSSISVKTSPVLIGFQDLDFSLWKDHTLTRPEPLCSGIPTLLPMMPSEECRPLLCSSFALQFWAQG